MAGEMAFWLKPLCKSMVTGFSDPADPSIHGSSPPTPGQMLEKSGWKQSWSVDEELMSMQGAGCLINSIPLSTNSFVWLSSATLESSHCWHELCFAGIVKKLVWDTISVHLPSAWGINKFVALQFPWILSESLKKSHTDSVLLGCYSRENACLRPHDFHQHHIIYQKETIFTQKRFFWNLAPWHDTVYSKQHLFPHTFWKWKRKPCLYQL